LYLAFGKVPRDFLQLAFREISSRVPRAAIALAFALVYVVSELLPVDPALARDRVDSFEISFPNPTRLNYG